MPELAVAMKRLARMPLHEVGYRLRERGRTELERAGWHRPPRPSGSFKASLIAGAERFYPGAGRSAAEFAARHFPQWTAAAVCEAQALCRHRVELLHLGPVDLGDAIDWHRDPYSGRRWESAFWAQYRPEDDPAGRDSKIIHELNRHQHLPRLAKAWLLTGSHPYAAEAVAQMLSWIGQNPTGVGINWQSSLEIAIRSLSWMWTLFLLRDSPALTDSAAQTIGDSLFAQLSHVARHTSLYSSPNTHLIGEAAALFIAGLTFDIAPWRGAGAALLAREADKQIASDGVYRENSSYYHCYALDFYLLAWILARHNRFPLTDTIPAKIRAMLDVVRDFTRPDGTLPLVGDDDGGRALALGQRTYRSFADGLCAGSILFRQGSYKQLCGGFAQETLWCLGENAWDEFRSIGARPPRGSSFFRPQSGYLAQRTAWEPSASHLLFDCGGLGMITGGHSHAGALSVTLFGGGKELLVDPGTFVYNGAPEWRRYFRSTAAHNTVTVDGRDQSPMTGTFRWGAPLACRSHRIDGLPVDYAEGQHGGYAPLGIVHRRAVVYVPGEYWILLDELRGAGDHVFDFHYHFGPDVEIAAFEFGEPSGSAVVWSANPGLLLAIFTSAPLAAEIAPGWMSRGYGHKQPIQRLRASVRQPAPVWAATFVIPAGERPQLRRLPADRGEAIACTLARQGGEDLIVLPCGRSEVSVAGFRMAGEFFWARRHGGRVENAVAIRSRRFQLDGANLLEDALCAPSAAS